MPDQPILNFDGLEAAAKALFLRERKYHTPTLSCPEPPNWEDLTDTSMEHYRGNAQAVLAAALPDVTTLEQVKREAKAEALEEAARSTPVRWDYPPHASALEIRPWLRGRAAQFRKETRTE